MGCMLLTGTVGVVRADDGAAVLTVAASIAPFSGARLRRRLRLKPLAGRGEHRRLVSLAWRVVAPVCPHAGP